MATTSGLTLGTEVKVIIATIITSGIIGDARGTEAARISSSIAGTSFLVRNQRESWCCVKKTSYPAAHYCDSSVTPLKLLLASEDNSVLAESAHDVALKVGL